MRNQPLKTKITDQYMKSEEGYFVAWSLATPPHSFGEWSLVSLREIVVDDTMKYLVEFVRSLTEREIEHIHQQPYFWWGMKLRDEPWALVQCRHGSVSSSASYRRRPPSSPGGSLKSTGV